MKKIIIGALAHVDAGKTTLSEAILYKTAVIRQKGRVDHEDAFLDYDYQERKRGITIYNKEARFSYRDKEYIYVDTPGHLDLSYEKDRAINIIDIALLIVSGADEIPGDTVKLFNKLLNYNIPVIIFVNKMDISFKNREDILKSLKERLNDNVCDYNDVIEHLSLKDEEYLNEYLEKGTLKKETVSSLLKNNYAIPVFYGSALKDEGIDDLLNFIYEYFESSTSDIKDLNAYVYKISNMNGERLTHIKVLSGTLLNKSEFNEEKINEIYLINGENTESVQMADEGELCAVKGLRNIEMGTYLPSLKKEEETINSSLTYSLEYGSLNINEAFKILEPLNNEFPELNLTKVEDKIYVNLSGELQSEIIRTLIKDRYNLDISYSAPIIHYKEKINEEVYGVGHFEPLRHYAEVVVKLTPIESGYRVKCLKNDSYSNSLVNYLRTYIPRGILINRPLTNIEITIVDYRTHLKHTEGGDLFDALRRAIRQGLTKTSSTVLEPYYLLTIDANEDNLSSIIERINTNNLMLNILEGSVITKVPEAIFNDFIISLRQKLKNNLSYSIEGKVYDNCLNEKEIIESFNYDYTSDLRNPAGSIFTRNGAGHYFSPEETEEVMHLNLSDYIEGYHKPAVFNKTRIDEDELKRVWNMIYKPKERYREKPVKEVLKNEENRRNSIDRSKPLIYLIDGYNLMYSIEEYGNIAGEDLMSAREKVINMVCDFKGYVSAECVLVFDAYRTESSTSRISNRDNITVVYTKENETADTYIENKSRELSKDYKVLVVTSDSLEQLMIFSNDAYRISTAEFIRRYNNMSKSYSKSDVNLKHKPLAVLKELLKEE